MSESSFRRTIGAMAKGQLEREHRLFDSLTTEERERQSVYDEFAITGDAAKLERDLRALNEYAGGDLSCS